MPDTWRVPVTPQRVIAFDDAAAEVRLATGSYIEEVRALPGAVEVIEYDPRTPDDVAEYEQLRASVTTALESSGSGDLVGMLDTNLFGLQVDPRVAPAV